MLGLFVLLLLIAFVLGAPIFAVMIGLAAVGAASTARGDFFSEFAGELATTQRMGTGDEAEILSTIPLFIFAGYLMAESKTADRVVRVSQAALGWIPGGLAVVTIMACAIFTTFTGASGVTIVALGGLLMPALIKESYPQRFSLGLVAGTGSVGLLFPPALPLFVYGTVYGLQESLAGSAAGEWDTARFVFAGIVPGMVLVGILCLFAIAVAVYRKVPRQKFDAKELATSLVVSLPEIAIPFLVIGALASGVLVFEIASLTVVYVLFLEMVVYRDLGPKRLPGVTRESMTLVGAIFIIILAASALTNYFVTAEIPQKMVEFVSDHVDSKWAFLLALNVLLIIVGMLMDIFSAIVVVVPLIHPIAKQYGIDPYHLGVIFLLNLEIGYLTPPVGLNLFIAAFKFQRPISEVIKATLPFLAAMLIALGIVTYIPALTIVPEAERRGRLDDLVRMVHEARVNLDTAQQVTLPDGTIKKFQECASLEGMDKTNCEILFADVTRCRENAGGEAGTQCEKDIIQQWVIDNDPNAGWDLEGDDDDDDDGGPGDLGPGGTNLDDLMEGLEDEEGDGEGDSDGTDGDGDAPVPGEEPLDDELQDLLDDPE